MPLQRPDLRGRVAIITGATRGIGRECALALARCGCNIVVAAKTTEPLPNLPGTIYTAAEEIRQLGVEALACQVDLRDVESCQRCVADTVARFGRVDILINNASALWWHSIEETPIKKLDLILSINTRGAFAMTQACLPHMRRGGFGRVISMSPPIHLNSLKDHTAYYISKFGMTLVALGVAQEYAGSNITGNSLWPATIVESLASINFKLMDRANWRKATILADAAVAIVGEPADFTGNMLLDDVYLRSKGLSDSDFVQYRCDPAVEPPRLLAKEVEEGFDPTIHNKLKRGDVRKVDRDLGLSKL
eukprot:EG_transcript_15330